MLMKVFNPNCRGGKTARLFFGAHLHFKEKDQTSALNGEWKLMLAARTLSWS